MSYEDNVIPFPKVKRNQAPQRSIIFDLEQKKVMISGSLVTILFLISFFNMKLFNSQKEVAPHQQQRGIASVAVEQRDTQWEHKLAQNLAHISLREPANAGKKPALLERLHYEDLKGQYIVRMDGASQKIQEIVYAKLEGENQLLLVPSRSDFIQKYSGLLPNYDKIIPDKVHSDKGGETYILKFENKKVAQVDFRIDTYGHLLQMRVNQEVH